MKKPVLDATVNLRHLLRQKIYTLNPLIMKLSKEGHNIMI